MKLGLLTDIHSHVFHLQAALGRLHTEHVAQLVVLGDVVDSFSRFDGVEETCRLLAEAKVVGVWGNHDYGLCVEPDAGVRSRYSAAVLDYMATLRPRLEIDGCLFSHVEPWLNAEYLPDLWYGGGPPDSPDKLARIFDAAPQRVIFAGHYHTWLAATPDGVRRLGRDDATRSGPGPLLRCRRALCEGNFATFDTVTRELLPMSTRE